MTCGRASFMATIVAGADRASRAGAMDGPYAAWEALVPPDDRPRWIRVQALARVRTIRDGVFRVPAPRRRERYIEHGVMTTTEGRPATNRRHDQDVTEQKGGRAERERRSSTSGRRQGARLLHSVAHCSAASLDDRTCSPSRHVDSRLVAPGGLRGAPSLSEMDVCSPGWRPFPDPVRSSARAGAWGCGSAYLIEHAPRGPGPFPDGGTGAHWSHSPRCSLTHRGAGDRAATAGSRSQLRQAQKMDALGHWRVACPDFNNFLTAIGGNAELALDETPADSLAKRPR